MEYVVAIVVVPVIAITVGWFYGRNTVNPYTTKGKAYYESNKGE